MDQCCLNATYWGTARVYTLDNPNSAMNQYIQKLLFHIFLFDDASIPYIYGFVIIPSFICLFTCLCTCLFICLLICLLVFLKLSQRDVLSGTCAVDVVQKAIN